MLDSTTPQASPSLQGMDRVRKASATQTAKDGIGALDALYELAVRHGASETAAAGFAHHANGALATLESQVHGEIHRCATLSRSAPQNGPDDHKNALLERAEEALRLAERLLIRPGRASVASPEAAIGAMRDILRDLEEARNPLFGDTMGMGVDDGPVFPKEREVARIGDMDPRIALRVGLDGDSDVYLSTTGDPGEGVEFCTPGSGGGKSKRTRDALIALMVAIEQDNADDPGRDWWKQRNDTSG